MAIFSWLMAQIYDRSMQDAETKCLHDWRLSLLGNLSGKVLEIGCGTGLNLEYYPDTVTQLTLLEPDANMRKKLHEKINVRKNSNIKIEILDYAAESISLPNDSYDAVVSTLVLCSVKNQNKVLTEVHRILHPGGKFVFIEHIAATNKPDRLKWQRRLEPLWKIIACNCHLTRPTEKAITQAGFSFDEITHQSMRGVPAIARPSIKGIAVKNTR